MCTAWVPVLNGVTNGRADKCGGRYADKWVLHWNTCILLQALYSWACAAHLSWAVSSLYSYCPFVYCVDDVNIKPQMQALLHHLLHCFTCVVSLSFTCVVSLVCIVPHVQLATAWEGLLRFVQFEQAVYLSQTIIGLELPMLRFAEIVKKLKPGGACIITFSNRCFPTKAITAWQNASSGYARVQVGAVGPRCSCWTGWECYFINTSLFPCQRYPFMFSPTPQPTLMYTHNLQLHTRTPYKYTYTLKQTNTCMKTLTYMPWQSTHAFLYSLVHSRTHSYTHNVTTSVNPVDSNSY